MSHIKRTWLPVVRANPETISRDYYQVLRRFPKADPTTFRGLFDDSGTLQAAAAIHFDEKPVFLELLLTAPWRKKGSGTALLLQLVEEAMATRAAGAIELKSAPGAITFYQRFGFVITKPPLKPEWDTPMLLSSIGAARLIQSVHCTSQAKLLPRQ